MKVYRNISEYTVQPKIVVTIGTFDGVHLGHKAIINALLEKAKQVKGSSLIITFWPHPRMVVNNNRAGVKLLNTLDEKIELFTELGVDHMLIIPFSKEVSLMNPGTFIHHILFNAVNAKHIVIGYDHRFGRNREGSMRFLENQAKTYGYDLTEVAAMELDNVPVSSTKIRRALDLGDVQMAKKFLGYHYSVRGIVGKGIGLGSTIGFPTANIEGIDDNKMIPADGVYAVALQIGINNYYGMLNIGNNPTIAGKGRSIEVHIFDFQQDIYKKNIKILFIERLRAEKKFAGMEELKLQLEKDRERSLEIAGSKN
jgi:riboflavin kinase / FMN adenylyltransferase